MAGILLFGLIARNSGVNCAPLPMSIGMARYARPHSSSMMWILWPFGVAHEYTSIIANALSRPCGAKGAPRDSSGSEAAMFKGFFANQGLGADFSEVSAWAKRRGHAFKREREGNGFVVDGKLEDTPWRLEWGPPQRPYITGHELRIRMELGLPPDLLMLLISKPLRELLEKQAFEQFT